jgi:hypothetical protein
MIKQINISDEDAAVIAECLRAAANDHKKFMELTSHLSSAETKEKQAEWLALLNRLAALFS